MYTGCRPLSLNTSHKGLLRAPDLSIRIWVVWLYLRVDSRSGFALTFNSDVPEAIFDDRLFWRGGKLVALIFVECSLLVVHSKYSVDAHALLSPSTQWYPTYEGLIVYFLRILFNHNMMLNPM